MKSNLRRKVEFGGNSRTLTHELGILSFRSYCIGNGIGFRVIRDLVIRDLVN